MCIFARSEHSVCWPVMHVSGIMCQIGVLITINVLFQQCTLKYVDALLVVIEALQNYIDDGLPIPTPSFSQTLVGTDQTTPWESGSSMMEHIFQV